MKLEVSVAGHQLQLEAATRKLLVLNFLGIHPDGRINGKESKIQFSICGI